MSVVEDLERRLREDLRALTETKLWLERSGAAYENPDAMLEIEREIARTRLLLEELERMKGVAE